MIKNLNIKTFLILSFLWILIILVILGGISIFFMQRLANQTIDFYENPHMIQLEVSEIQKDMAEMGSQIKEALTYKTDAMTQETTEILSDYLEEMNTHIEDVKSRYRGDESLLKTADAGIVKWLAANDKIREAMESDRYDEAMSIFQDEYIPAESNMIDAVEKIYEYADDVTLSYYETAQRSKVISLAVILIMIVIAIVLAIVVCFITVKSIIVPLRKVQMTAEALSQGNLKFKVDYEGKNEFGQLAASMRKTTQTMSDYISDIDYTLDQIANDNLILDVQANYVGDFARIKISIEKIIGSLNHTMSQIKNCAEQVAGGAEQASSSSSVLSQGASEQATTLEEITNNLDSVTDNIRRNAQYTEDTNELVEQVGSRLEQGNDQMRQMLDAISDINSASDQIAKIIKTIEDIAFQTNILALNAAVEAARAGEAGKGFAVVADEVRNLAGKSAEAAKSTTELIQNSIRAVDHGTKIAKDTALTLESVVSGAMEITGKVSMITESSEEQAASIVQVNEAMNQVSQVVQTNSATAEETAAISEELSGQSQVLENLVNKFRLK